MEKHTIGHDPALTFDEASAYALDLLRERGDLPDGKDYTVEDGTTDAHRDNVDQAGQPAPEAVVVVRVYDPGELERLAAEADAAAAAAALATDPVAQYRAAVEAAGRALEEALNGPKLG
jgi:hypothetical protein